MQNEMTDVGYLSVAAGTANKAYPLPGVRAEIYLENENGDTALLRSLTTNASGLAEPVEIPTPPAENSLSPDDNSAKTSGRVRIRLYKEGYYPVEAVSVPVFGGVRSIQYFDLIPIAKSGQYAPPSGETIIVESADSALSEAV